MSICVHMYTFIFHCGRIHITTNLPSYPFLCAWLRTWHQVCPPEAPPSPPSISRTLFNLKKGNWVPIKHELPISSLLWCPGNHHPKSRWLIRHFTLNMMSSRFSWVVTHVRIPLLMRAGPHRAVGTYCTRCLLRWKWLFLSPDTCGSEEYSASLPARPPRGCSLSSR